MIRPSILFAACLALAAGGTAAAADPRPTTYDELRALAGQRLDDASSSTPAVPCGRTPTSTDEARALAGAHRAAAVAAREPARAPATRAPASTDDARAQAAAQRAVVVAAREPARAPAASVPTSTDEARALVAAATAARVAPSAPGHAAACATACACRHDAHGTRAGAPCPDCRKRT